MEATIQPRVTLAELEAQAQQTCASIKDFPQMRYSLRETFYSYFRR